MKQLRTAEEARAELKRQGISITAWSLANGFSPNLVFEVLGGRKKCARGAAHNIAVKLGLKDGVVCTDPARALDTHADRRIAA
ncbi:DNA-binding protein [Rhodocyclus gracilis]|uniref:DNA-binding protein n=1 Tax=Rhodocyclus tenuis TaxID=1066 RepID=A0A6L5JTN6_RHOTE|nr:DNA-binding protein [Rhodocyclus gracilis]MQY50763.1 DNA-binding protein [Rhodocyclus gracilis]